MKEQEKPTALAKKPLFFSSSDFSISKEERPGVDHAEKKEFHIHGSDWLLKGMNSNGRNKLALGDETKRILLNLEVMSSELQHYLTGQQGAKNRIVLNDTDQTTAIAVEKLPNFHTFMHGALNSFEACRSEELEASKLTIDELLKRERPQTAVDLDKNLKRFLTYISTQAILEDPDFNPDNYVFNDKTLMKIDQGWGAFPLLLTLMDNPVENKIDLLTLAWQFYGCLKYQRGFSDEVVKFDMLQILQVMTQCWQFGAGLGDTGKALLSLPVGIIIKNFLPEFCDTMELSWLQKAYIENSYREVFDMNLTDLLALSMKDDSLPIKYMVWLVCPTLLYQLVEVKGPAYLNEAQLIELKGVVKQYIQSGLDDYHAYKAEHTSYLRTASNLMLRAVGVMPPPLTAARLTSNAFQTKLTDALKAVHWEVKEPVEHVRTLIASQLDLKFYSSLMKKIEKELMLGVKFKNYSENEKLDLMITTHFDECTQFLLIDKEMIKKAAEIAFIPEEQMEQVTAYYFDRQTEYTSQLLKNDGYCSYFKEKHQELHDTLKAGIEAFLDDNQDYAELSLIDKFEDAFNEWADKMLDASEELTHGRIL